MMFEMLDQLPAVVRDFLQLSVWLILLSVIFLPLERLFALSPQKILRREIGIDLGYYFLNGLFIAIFLGAPLTLVAMAAHHVVPDAFLQTVASWPLWLRLPVALLIAETGFYWGHRWTHQIPFLWRFHAIHHSAKSMDFLVNTRLHPVDMVFDRLCGLIPLYVLGFAQPTASGALAPLLLTVIGTLWGFVIHANLRWRLGPLEWLISSPAFHHWHHTRSEHKDRNFAPLLPFLDYLFGTLYLPRDKWPTDYGIEGEMDPTFSGQLVQPFGKS